MDYDFVLQSGRLSIVHSESLPLSLSVDILAIHLAFFLVYQALFGKLKNVQGYHQDTNLILTNFNNKIKGMMQRGV